MLDNNGTEDNVRIDYLYSYMEAVLDAVEIHGIDLRGYTIWSLMDTFEWYYGHTWVLVIFNVFSFLIEFSDMFYNPIFY